MRTRTQENGTKRTYQRICHHRNKGSCRPHIISSTQSSNQNTGPVIDTTRLKFVYTVGKESGSQAIMVCFKCEWGRSAELGNKGGREADHLNYGMNDKEGDTSNVTADERIERSSLHRCG